MTGSDSHLDDGRAAAQGAPVGTAAALLAPETAARMAAAALALLRAVAVEQQPVLNPRFDDFDLESTRRHWTYLPELERPALPLRGMPDALRKVAHELITAS